MCVYKYVYVCVCVCVSVCVCEEIGNVYQNPIIIYINYDSVLKKIKNRKAAGLDEIPPEEWKTRQFDDILLRQCNAVYSQNRIERWMKGCIHPFPKATSD